MSFLDYVIIIIYFTLILYVGTRSTGKQTSLKDYFLGNRNLPWYAAMFSGMATRASAIGYVGASGVAFTGDFTSYQIRLGIPVEIVILCALMLPIFYRSNNASIYQYLDRFDKKNSLVLLANRRV